MVQQVDQGVAVKTNEVPARSRADRLRTRLQRLQLISESKPPGTDLLTKAVAALSQVHAEGGREITHVYVRSSFVTRRQDLQGEMSDRRPPQGPKPPAVDITAPRGIALQVLLVALFVAQAQKSRQRDGRVTFDVELETKESSKTDWIDLVVPDSGHTPEAVEAADRRDKRLRRLKRALDSLEAKDLVDLPGKGKARDKYAGFHLLDEGGARPTGPPLVYRLPTSGTDDVIAIPVEFFLNGWVHVLTDSEIALWLMLRHHAGPTYVADPQPLSISGSLRQGRYAVTKDAYKGWWLLHHAGLLDADVDPGRRADGTVENFTSEDPPHRHRFFITDDGLGKPAAPAVKVALDTALGGGPIGINRIQMASLLYLL